MVSRAYGKSLLGRPKLIRSPNPTLQDYLVGLGPFAYWPLSETSGTVAVDIVGGYHGTYNNVTLNATTFPDGSPAPLFDANNEVVSLPVVALDTPFDPARGTLLWWYKVRAASVWTDGTSRVPLSFGADANNRIFPTKSNTNNTFQMSYRAASTAELSSESSYSPTRWTVGALTWDLATENACRFYLDGVEKTPSATLGTWSGALSTSFTAIGNFTSAGGATHADGYVKHVAIWNRALSAAEILLAMPVSFLV